MPGRVARARLDNGAAVAVIGGGPAGSLFSHSILQTAGRVGLDLRVDVYEPRDFTRGGPGSCNMCGGIISESLVQELASEGIRLPLSVLQRRIDSYFLHMDVGSVMIRTPGEEKRIASVHRGAGPRTFRPLNDSSLDAHLLGIAREKGARLVPERVTGIGWQDDRPRVLTQAGREQTYDLVAVATGVNAGALKQFDVPGADYVPPRRARAYICEMYLGQNIVKRFIGSSMHVFLLDLPRIEFAAIIPKSDYVTICLLGEDVDRETVRAFLDSPEVREWMPPLWEPPREFCHCAPRINVGGAERPYADRVVFIGDSAATKLYKDGIGAAYRTARAAAITAVFDGVSAEAFRRHYWPVCKAIESDNRIGKLVFRLTRRIQKRTYARRGVWKMVREEQHTGGRRPRMSGVLWDVFTGSASYRSILARALHPAFVGRLVWSTVTGNRSAPTRKRRRKQSMGISTEGVLGKKYSDGQVIYRQGDPGDCMYFIQEGAVQVLQRVGGKEFCLAELGAGDMFGELAVFEKESRRATVRAVGDVSVSVLERDTLLRALHKDPSLSFKLIQQMAYRIRELETALVRRASAGLDENVAASSACSRTGPVATAETGH